MCLADWRNSRGSCFLVCFRSDVLLDDTCLHYTRIEALTSSPLEASAPHAICASAGTRRHLDLGDCAMAYNEKVFNRQYPVVFFFVQHLAYNKGLKAAWDGTKNPSAFWESATDSHLKLATIAWCNVFGSRNSDMHWMKTTAGEIPKQVQEDFRQRVLFKTGFTEERWEDVQSSSNDQHLLRRRLRVVPLRADPL